MTKEGTPLSYARSSTELREPHSFTKEFAKTAGVTTAAGVGSMALTMAGLPFVGPFVMIGALAMPFLSADDKLKYERDFREKVRADVTHLESNATLTSSVFFPLVKDARSIVVEYSRGNNFDQGNRIEIPLQEPLVAGGTDSQSAQAFSGQTITADTRQQSEPKQTPQDAEGSPNIDAKEAQLILNALGYNVGSADGVLGKRSLDAIRQFQQNVGLQVTGSLDEPTKRALSTRKPK